MRKYIILFFSVFPFLFACNNSGAPANLIKKDQMTALLVQVHLTDSKLMFLQQVPDTLYKYGTAHFQAVFKKFHTDSAQFRASYKYYSTQPKEFQEIYDSVLAKLQFKSDSLNKLLKIQSLDRFKKNPKAAGPAINTANKYGVGMSPQVPVTNHVAPQRFQPGPLGHMQRFRAKRDSIKKGLIKLKP